MAINREKFSGEGIEQAKGRKKPRIWQREPKSRKRYAEVLLSEPKMPLPAEALHTGSRLPQGTNPEDLLKTPEEELTRLEERIHSDEFSDAEKEFFDAMIEKYPHELQIAKEKRKENGGAIDDKWAAWVRTSYINDRKRAGLDKGRWEPKVPLAPEKADLFERYLNLKLPYGIPEEKIQNPLENVGKANNENSKNLMIKNKHMEIPIKEIKNIRERIKQDREELEAAGMVPSVVDSKSSTIDSSGGKGKNIEEALSDQAKEPFYPPVIVSGSERERSVVPVRPVYTAEPIPDVEPTVTKPEDIRQAELNQVINDFEAKQSQIAKMRAKKTGRFASLVKSLGIKTKNLSEDPEVMDLEKESHDLYRNLLSKGIHLYKGDKPQLENFLKQFDEFEVFKTTYNHEMDERVKNCKWPETVLARFQKIGQKWSEMSWKKKLLIGGAAGGLMTVGAIALGAGTFGAAALGAGYRWGFRGFGAMAVGVGRKVQLDKKMMEEIDQNSHERLAKKMKLLEEYEHNLDAGIAAVVNQPGIADVRKNYEERSLKNTKKARNLAVGSFAISSTVGELLRASGISFGSVVKKIGEHTGVSLAGVKESVGHFLSGDQATVQGLGGGAAATQAVEHLQPSGGMPQDLSEEDYARIQKTMASYGPGRNMDEIVAEEAAKMHAGGIMPEPEVQTPEIAKPKFEDIASVKIKAGGSMWGSIENNIKANPAAYGLDPNDPSFTKDMHRMTQQMLDEFASRKGLSYEQLDQMARGGKVQPGSTFNIIHDPSTDEIYLDDKGKIFGADVSPGGASAAHEIAPSKASMPIDDMKPKTASIAPEDATRPRAGAAAEQQTTRARGGGKMKFSPEIEEMDRKAQASTAKALESQQHADSLKAQSVHEVAEAAKNNTKLYLSTRGLVNDIVNGAGVGNRANFWEHSMDNWKNLLGSEYQISQDVRFNDAINKTNISLNKLRSLYPILEKYHRQGIESIGDCLKEAVKNTKDLYEINKLVLRK